MLNSLELYKAWTLKLAQAFSLLFFYGIIASMAAANLGMALTLFFWILSGVWMRHAGRVSRSPIALPIVALLLITAISLSYTVAPLAYVGRYFLVYGKWLFVLVLISIHDDPKWVKAIFVTMALAVLIVLVSTYGNVFFDISWANTPGGFGVDNSIFYDYIAQGIMSVCASVVAWVLAFRSDSKNIRRSAAAIFFLLTFSLLFLINSRTAQLALVVAVVVVSTLIFNKRHFQIFSLIFSATVIAALMFSPVLLSKIYLIIYESSVFFEQRNEMTSVGTRLSMWVNSLQFIADAPFFGHGVGSYRYLSERVYTDVAMCAIACVHPHNQLLFFMVEYGVIGFLLFALFIRAFVLVIRSWRWHNPSVFSIVLGLLAVFLVDSFINSPLWISSLRNFYIGIFALIFIYHALVQKVD